MRVGVVSWLYPSRRNPVNGTFVREELERLAAFADIRLIAPLHNQYWFGEPHGETAGARYPVLRPFTLLFPSWFLQRFSPAAMAATLARHRGFFSGCDLVHVHNAFPDAVAAVRAFGREFPVAVTVHGSDVNLLMERRALRSMIAETLSAARLVICVSRALASALREHGVTARTEVIPNGIDTALFAPGNKRLSCEALGLDPDCPRILYAGNFLPWKGIEYLIRAMPDTVRAFPGCELVLLGARPGTGDRGRYRGLIAETGMERTVSIREWVPNRELPSWLHAADVFALPSLAEGFGIVAAEALACGIPVVATRSGGPEDIVTVGLGHLVPPADASSLAVALARALRREGVLDPETIARSASERFSHETVTRRILDVYGRVAG